MIWVITTMVLKRSISSAPDAPFSVSIGPALFHLDDVEDIRKALKEFGDQQDVSGGDESDPIKVEIRALTATADQVVDLKDATVGELGHVSLILSRPKIKVDLHIHEAEIIAESDNPAVKKFVEGISSANERVLERSGRKNSY